MIFLFIVLFIFLLGGVPIFISLGLAPILHLILSGDIPVFVVAQRVFGGLDKFSLMAMPFFIFAADIMRFGGLAKRLLDFTNSITGFMRGGLALTTQLACMFFGALSGSSPATVAAMGGLMYPEMVAKKYPKGFAIGLITTSGAVAILIPPSISLIIFGTVTGVSIGALFIGGIGAGIIFGTVISIYSFFYSVKLKRLPDAHFSMKRIINTGKMASWALGVPVIILGGIYFGIFTPTEAAGVSAVYAILVSMFIYKEIDLKKLYEISLTSATTLGSVMVLVACASIFGWVLTVYQAPQQLASLLLSPGAKLSTFWISANLLFLIAGMFMDGVGATIILAPLIYPIAMQMGVNPVHLGVVVSVNIAIGMITPPFGLNLFVASGITKEPMTVIIPAILPFILLTLIVLLIVTCFPEISLFLPRLVYPGSF